MIRMVVGNLPLLSGFWEKFSAHTEFPPLAVFSVLRPTTLPLLLTFLNLISHKRLDAFFSTHYSEVEP